MFVLVDSFMVGPGDRFDFILGALKKTGCYSMRFKGLGDCGPPKAEIHGEAFVCYGNSTPKYICTFYKEADRNGTVDYNIFPIQFMYVKIFLVQCSF